MGSDLKDQAGRDPFASAAGDAQKFAALLEPLWRGAHRSGGEALATLGAAPRQDPPSADGGASCTEAVAALADQDAGLISAFHD